MLMQYFFHLNGREERVGNMFQIFTTADKIRADIKIRTSRSSSG